MRLVFAGTPSVALPALKALLASSHEVVAVVTRPDAPRGRSKRPTPSDVAAFASEQGLPVLTPAHPRDEDFVDALTRLSPDACPVVAYGALIPQRVLDIPRFGWINLHFSLLPRWRGAAPVQRAIMAGDAQTGATTFRLVRELDAGPVFDQVTLPLTGIDTSGEVLDALAASGADLLLSTLDRLPDLEPVAQPERGVTLAPKVEAADVRLDWTAPAVVLDRLIRGANPAPIAWTTLDGERLKVILARPAKADGLAPGELRVEKRRVLAGTGDGTLELLTVQAPGKKAMAAPDWSRGLRDVTPRLI